MSRRLPPGGRDRELVVGTRAHYADGPLYDHLYRHRRADARFYERIAREDGGPVLELGCGTGRVALPIARAGIEIVGVDLSEAMLATARKRLARLPARSRLLATFLRGDFRALRLGRRFPLVFAPFNALQHCYDRGDWERTLRAVRRHLTRRGRFVFDVLLPDPVLQSRRPERRFSRTPLKNPVTGRRFVYTERFVHDPQRQILFIYQHLDDEEPSRHRVVPIAHRQVYPLELEALLHYNGLRIVERLGGFAGEKPTEASESQVIVAVRRS